jgi:hypothetical protein
MGNLDLYNKIRVVPADAQKTIGGGRLNGMTDINPMWRIKTLTEQFGVCGIGWKYKVTDKRTIEGAKNEIAAFVDIDLYIKVDGEWSEAIPGTGGSAFVANEKNGLYTSDECFKMAMTDAIGVACKALGIGADIYWHDKTKYSDKPEPKDPPKAPEKPPIQNAKPPEQKPAQKTEDAGYLTCDECGVEITQKVADYSYGKMGRALCFKCQKL